MLRRMALVVPMGLMLLAGCSPSGRPENPFAKPKPFVATAVPADFAIVVDENHDTYYARQHIQQVITAADTMSRTSYTNYRDYNDTVARRFSQETPLSASQLQAMWNEVRRNELMIGSRLFINWRSDADIYKRNTYTIQIRANGQTMSYHRTNGFGGTARPVMLLVEAVRLPITQEAGTPVVEPMGEEAPAATEPASMPATVPATDAATKP